MFPAKQYHTIAKVAVTLHIKQKRRHRMLCSTRLRVSCHAEPHTEHHADTYGERSRRARTIAQRQARGKGDQAADQGANRRPCQGRRSEQRQQSARTRNRHGERVGGMGWDGVRWGWNGVRWGGWVGGWTYKWVGEWVRAHQKNGR